MKVYKNYFRGTALILFQSGKTLPTTFEYLYFKKNEALQKSSYNMKQKQQTIEQVMKLSKNHLISQK